MDYFLRFTESDKPAVRALGILLGELHDTEDDSLVGNGFVYIGTLTEPTGETTTDEDGNIVELRQPILDPTGEPYIHANLRTNQDLSGVADFGRYCLLHEQDVLDEEGNVIAKAGSPRSPNRPQWVFA